ncbi:MAG: cell division protein FtsZ [Dehalococcoidales bacterium]|jgi:cell division GTPase FtsZ|nr:cell division protein FtsZ [Dehalococcoidales bacterium]|tara:strand:+ start:345 stop:1520 length:1176 start_codon:yes stop_codon:yes gene_type:complete
MKLVVIGLGQCGSRVADEFARLNKRARAQRSIEICPGVFAVNTDAADLTGLATIKTDYQHRILIGGRKTGGHGVGKINELGAEVAREDVDKVVDALRSAKRFYETDGFLLIAGAAGGTGSGSIPIIAQHVKERYPDKPVYALVILPFEHEEETEERTIYNTAVCLKSVDSVADAVILIDNQRYVRKDFSLKNNLAKINSLIVEPFYDFLCAGEEKKAKYIGAKTLDAGDIIQTLLGWTTIGFGKSQLKLIKLPFEKTLNFRAKSIETHKGIQSMDEAISELSIRCNPKDAGRALYLISAPAKEMNLGLVKDLGDWLRELAPNAIIRNGDYPRERGVLEVTLILSELSDVEKVRKYYTESTDLVPIIKRRQKEVAAKLQGIEEAAKDIPSLL